MKSSPPSDPQPEQLGLWPNLPSSSASASRQRRPSQTSSIKQALSELSQVRQTLVNVNQTLEAIATEQSDQKVRLQAMQALRSLPERVENLAVHLQDLESLKSLEHLPEILTTFQQQSQNQSAAIAELRQAIAQMLQELSRIERNLPGVLNHPVKTILNGAELSVKHLLAALAIASVLMGVVGGALVLTFLPSMLNRTEMLERINGRVNNLELNQRKLLEPQN